MYEDKLDERITGSEYDKKREEYRRKQESIRYKIKKLNMADEEYYVTAEYIINLSRRAPELFESSKLEEKRQFINMTLQNLKLNRKNIEYSLVKPFDAILSCNKRHNWLRGQDSNLQPIG